MVDAGGTKHGASHEGRSRTPHRSSAETRKKEVPASLPEATHVVRQDVAGEFPTSLKTGGISLAPTADSSHLDPDGLGEPTQTLAVSEVRTRKVSGLTPETVLPKQLKGTRGKPRQVLRLIV